ncbi:unnamed protein product, partial [Brassica rapa]
MEESDVSGVFQNGSNIFEMHKTHSQNVDEEETSSYNLDYEARQNIPFQKKETETCKKGNWKLSTSFGRKTLYHDLLLAENNRRDKIVKAYYIRAWRWGKQPSPVTVSDNINAKIALQLENFVRSNVSKTQSMKYLLLLNSCPTRPSS